MITNEEHENFLSTLDQEIKSGISATIISTEQINYCLDRYNLLRSGGMLPIVWVKEGHTPIKEFYPSELNLSWLVTFSTYYRTFLSSNPLDTELYDMYMSCRYMYFVLNNIRGINIVDGVTYVLEHDCEFVEYKLDRKLFI